MDSDGDKMFLSPPETSPTQQRRLKVLEKKAHLERSDTVIESFGEAIAKIDGPGKDSKVGKSRKKLTTSEGIESVGNENGDIDGFVKGSKERKSGKKRGSSEETEENKKKMKKARNADGQANSEVSERKAYLEKLSLCISFFFETRDASFKHVQIVQKPVSSVLEKIYSRKLEVQKNTKIGIRAAVSSKSFDHPTFMDASSREPTGILVWNVPRVMEMAWLTVKKSYAGYRAWQYTMRMQRVVP